jgi:hypothetical protein
MHGGPGGPPPKKSSPPPKKGKPAKKDDKKKDPPALQGAKGASAGHEIGEAAGHGKEVRAKANEKIAKTSYDHLVAPVAKKYGPKSKEALKAKLEWEEINSKRMPIKDALKAIGQEDAAGAAADAAIFAKALKGASKGLTVVGAGADVYDLATTHSNKDRALDAVSLLDTLAAAGVAVGLISTAAGPAIVVVGAGIAIYELSSLAYEYRHQIEHALVSGTKYMLDHPWLFAGPAGEAVYETYKHWGDIAHEAEQIAKDAWDLGKAGLHDVEKGIGWVGGEVGKVGKIIP